MGVQKPERMTLDDYDPQNDSDCIFLHLVASYDEFLVKSSSELRCSYTPVSSDDTNKRGGTSIPNSWWWLLA